MQHDAVQSRLSEAADKISAYLTSLSLKHEVRFYAYMINVQIIQGARQAVLSVAYSPKKNRWTPYSADEWVKESLVPRIEQVIQGKNSSTPPAKQMLPPQRASQSQPSRIEYFANALESLRILDPFNQEYIDFTVIGEQAKQGLRRVLHDPQCTDVDRQLLTTALASSLSSEYSAAKEFLFQCLTLCHLPLPTNR
jgi:hypothetical protein